VKFNVEGVHIGQTAIGSIGSLRLKHFLVMPKVIDGCGQGVFHHDSSTMDAENFRKSHPAIATALDAFSHYSFLMSKENFIPSNFQGLIHSSHKGGLTE